MPKVDRNSKRIAGYKLPESLIRRIKVYAAEEGVWPADVVEKACEEFLRNSARGRPVASNRYPA